MKLIVALGNPGEKYNFTRHNFGFLALDYYFKVYNLTWHKKPQFGAIYAESGDFLFLKPETFYNNVGSAVRSFSDYYKIPPKDILVLCDDFDLPFGTFRYREKGSAGGNNGLKSIISSLKTEDFPRLRLGTDNPDLRSKLGDIDFVLGKFTPEEKEALPDLLSRISKEITARLS